MKLTLITVSLFVILKLSNSAVIPDNKLTENLDVETNKENDTLIFAHVVSKLSFFTAKESNFEFYDLNFKLFRHGDRNIARRYPNDPYKDESNWPGGYGQLTKVKLLQKIL